MTKLRQDRAVSLMVQGAGSDVGKSLLVAGLARALTRRGLSVRPFKPQNMSNNAAVTADGGEIGRAQALQALAAGVEPVTDMNPVLLKPETETGAQVIVQGRRVASVRARDYAKLKPSLMAPVRESFARLKSEADIVLVEGAGSPAEVNLRAGDIANMGFARAEDVPVVLVGDIDRGGVIAQLVGCREVLDPADAAMVKGFIVNKFRGDVTLFDEGARMIADRTGWADLGVAAWFDEAHRLPAEDALGLASGPRAGPVKIAVPMLSRIANFDDLDPLKQDAEVVMVRPGSALPGDADVVILPGSKSTRGDLAFLRAQGWDIDLKAHVRRGGRVLGLCGGYQMLGRRIADPEGLEGPPGEDEGLGFLDVETVMSRDKTLTRVTGRHLGTGQAVAGYEIHLGRTQGPDTGRPWAEIEGRPEGAVSTDGLVAGAYVHGVFAADGFRAAWLKALGGDGRVGAYGAGVEAVLDRLADKLERELRVDRMLELAR